MDLSNPIQSLGLVKGNDVTPLNEPCLCLDKYITESYTWSYDCRIIIGCRLTWAIPIRHIFTITEVTLVGVVHRLHDVTPNLSTL